MAVTVKMADTAFLTIGTAVSYTHLIVCSVRTAARFTERERVPVKIIHRFDMRGKFTATVNSNYPIGTVQTAHLLDRKNRSRSIGCPSDVKNSAKTVL